MSATVEPAGMTQGGGQTTPAVQSAASIERSISMPAGGGSAISGKSDRKTGSAGSGHSESIHDLVPAGLVKVRYTFIIICIV